MSFAKFAFSPPLDENLRRQGFEVPTPIQAQAIPEVLAGHDVMGLAQTGTGKTAAFVLPMLQKLHAAGPRHRVRALIIGPTRELVGQISEVVHQLGRGTHLHSALVYGGVGMKPQVDAIRRGAEIVAGCPGRLLDHLRQRTLDLSHLEILVLDEADQMFDMGFLPDIRQIIKMTPASRQTLMFSATMPEEIRRLAHDFLRNPRTVEVARSAPVETVRHALFPVQMHLKTPLVIALLRKTDTGPVIIFTRTKHRTKKLDQQLQREGFASTSIQGNLSQSQRTRAMDGFKRGEFQILVATDIASRGIDVSDISHVINYDMPATVDHYIHRIGRTGRAAKTGDAYTLITQADTGLVRQIEKRMGATIERRQLEGFDYKAAPTSPPDPRDRESRPGQRHGSSHGPSRSSHGHARPQGSSGGPRHGGFHSRPRTETKKPWH